MNLRFDAVVVADWSSAASPSPATPGADAIWIGEWRPGAEASSAYHRTRAAAEAALVERLDRAVAEGQRVLLTFDFAFGYPAGFAERVCGHAHAFALWDWLAAEIADGPDNANNRFEVADRINSRFSGTGPFWGHPQGREFAHLPMRDTRRNHGVALHRLTETEADGRPKSIFQAAYAGSVGGQSLVGLPMLARLRRRYEGRLGAWPFEDHALDRAIVLAEVYPSLLPVPPDGQEVRDDLQVRTLASALGGLQEREGLAAAFGAARGDALHEEGWILGVGAEAALRAAAQPGPVLRNDCFALPPGVDWTPVDAALDRLREALGPVVGTETVATEAAGGRILARDAVARRANPPAANAAVDGYGFARAAVGEGARTLPLADGRAAAGAPFGGAVPPGSAVRILTGAILPEGVDTVVLEEDVETARGAVTFRADLRAGANTRKAGEDVAAGAVALSRGRRLSPPDLALLTALGLAEVEVCRPLRVAVLSTGDELAAPGEAEAASRTFDANRPMLLDLIRVWGSVPVDLGRVGDNRTALRDRLDRGAAEADAILTSGGASAGDEDHVSALLREAGAMETWRVAMKPGRPLALGLWRGRPVFGLPGNPVAAFVCALVFARPALSLMAGADWLVPAGLTVPAAFEKRKKPGRREYLRARLDAEGRAEVFPSEGSGRISGLSWATGLVELEDAGRHVRPGDPVRFVPYSAFGL